MHMRNYQHLTAQEAAAPMGVDNQKIADLVRLRNEIGDMADQYTQAILRIQEGRT